MKRIKANVIQEFKGEINGVEFDQRWEYDSTLFMLGAVPDFEGIDIQRLVEEYQKLLQNCYDFNAHFSVSEIEKDILYFMIFRDLKYLTELTPYCDGFAKAYLKQS